jgi:preprotein translocase subunit SecB
MESQIRTLSVYMTDMSFETNTKIAHYHPESNLEKERHVDVKVNRVQGFLPSKSIFQVVLTHTLQLNETVSGHERHVGEVSYAGNFEIEGMPGHQADRFLNVDCAKILEPYANQRLHDMFLHAGYQLQGESLSMVDYAAIYEQS